VRVEIISNMASVFFPAAQITGQSPLCPRINALRRVGPACRGLLRAGGGPGLNPVNQVSSRGGTSAAARWPWLDSPMCKSAVFNVLTGLNQHVGNWPGKTVEQKTGEFTFEGKTIRLVDLPGTYSLTANSEEERIARDFILRERPDVIVVIANATALERNLYLVTGLSWVRRTAG